MFISLEGPEGGGKSTLQRALAAALERDGYSVLTTREPGAGPVGAKIRELLLEGDSLEPRAELFLFLADRAQHVARIIRPALEQGQIVLCDRFADSTVVYQGHGRGLPLEDLRAWNAFATGGLLPDVTLLLDLDPAKGLDRIGSKDRLDREPLEFHEKIRQGFLKEARREPRRFVVIDALQTPGDVLQDALQALPLRRGKTQ